MSIRIRSGVATRSRSTASSAERASVIRCPERLSTAPASIRLAGLSSTIRMFRLVASSTDMRDLLNGGYGPPNDLFQPAEQLDGADGPLLEHAGDVAVQGRFVFVRQLFGRDHQHRH